MLVFLGCHNKVKALSWLLLSQYPGLGYARIAALVGTSPPSMSVLVGRWVKWQYVVRGGVRGGYVYSLDGKAMTWLNKHLNTMPLDIWLAGLSAEKQRYFAKVFQVWLQRRGEGR